MRFNLRGDGFDDERNERWVNASHGLGRVEALMVPTAQGLGILDCRLIAEDVRFEELSEPERGTIQESVLLTDRFTLSSLWVMGAYELVRTFDERYKNDDISVVGEAAECLKLLKGLERLSWTLAICEWKG